MQIARLVGVQFQTIGKWMKKYGLKPRPYGTTGLGYRFMGHVLSEETKNKISKAHTGKKLSFEHIAKIIKNLSHFSGDKSLSWKGGRWIDKTGYQEVYCPDQSTRSKPYIKEHRLVMQLYLGRKLLSSEHIHHLNGNKLDNRIENLILLSNSEHRKLHGLDPEYRKSQSLKMIEARRGVKNWSTKKKV